ncbi:unnamed protein product, partial [Mesorhabditis belari]|uniref:Transthyretin-like family protein n=1 Tax=Mesorhabditis belari TaxID=2138241 RepID=A0AAF3E8Q2_9BILA
MLFVGVALLGLFGACMADSVAVEGVLTCDGRPASGVLVKLYEKDTLLDDKLASGKSDSQGRFRLQGSQSEFGGIKTKFNVYHKCGTLPFTRRFIPTCTFKASFDIPSRYVAGGNSPRETYNAQTLELLSSHQGH